MLRRSQIVETITCVSEVLPDISTQNPEAAKTIAWADANPFV